MCIYIVCDGIVCIVLIWAVCILYEYIVCGDYVCLLYLYIVL